jgi:hypothetical protein
MYPLGERILAHAEPELMATSVITDSRKFEEQGAWRSLGRVCMLAACTHFALPQPSFLDRFFQDVR